MNGNDLPLDRHLMLIVNPVSGRRQSTKVLPEVVRALMDGGYQVTTFITASRGDASRFAAQYGAQFDRIVSVGGDGTFSETVAGVVSAGLHVPVGMIPAGSTNDFSACHGIPSDPVEAARALVAGAPRPLDVGMLDGHSFCYIAAFGAFSWLSYTTPQPLKNALGHSAYILDGIKELPRIHAEHLRITTEQRCIEGNFIFGAVCNTSSVAGTFSLPKEEVCTSDGLFEILLVYEPVTLLELQAEINALRTQNYESPLVEFFRAPGLTVETDGAMEWSLDGERADGGRLVQVENLRRRLTLIC